MSAVAPAGPVRSLKRVLTLVSLVLVLSAELAGCGASTSQQVAVAKAYAKALVPALHAETLDPLRKVATADEVDRVRLYVIDYLEGRNQRIVARLVEQTITGTRNTASDSTEVDAVERWSITYVDAKTGATVGSLQRTDHARYTVKKLDGKWLVTSVAVQ